MKKDKIFIITIIVLFIDIVIKELIKTNVALSQNIVLIPNFFSITHVQNTGAAFSIFANSKYFLIIISIIILIMLLKYIKDIKIKNKYEIIALGLVLGGLLGNLSDRIMYSYVIDYLSFNIFGYMFPIFNFADMAITIGMIMLIITMLYKEKRKKK